jgi:hypothetical protein
LALRWLFLDPKITKKKAYGELFVAMKMRNGLNNRLDYKKDAFNTKNIPTALVK